MSETSNIEPFVELHCNGKLQYKNGRLYKCDFMHYFFIEGLDLDKFECPICGCKSCSIKTIEKLLPFWVMKLGFLCRRFQKMRIRLKPENREKFREWIKSYQEKMKKIAQQSVDNGLNDRAVDSQLKLVQKEFMEKLDKIHQEMYGEIN